MISTIFLRMKKKLTERLCFFTEFIRIFLEKKSARSRDREIYTQSEFLMLKITCVYMRARDACSEGFVTLRRDDQPI